MKRAATLVAIVAIITIFVSGLLADAGAVSAQPAGAASSRLDEVQARGTLRACTTGDYKPYSYYRPDGQFEGIDIDMTKSLAKSLGVKVEFVKTTWPTLTSDFIAK
ncbi:MAG TPA: transporter substrate-binding domain-containing protein, partial [Paraburkholderia sp.]